MRSPIRKHLLSAFGSEFETRFSQFSKVIQERGSPALWEWKVALGLRLFVMLDTFPNEDTFVVEIAWNCGREFPWDAGHELDFNAPCWRERLGWLWEHGEKTEHKWELVPEEKAAMDAVWKAWERDESGVYPPDVPIKEVIPRIAPMVDDCLQKFQKYGVPVFQKLAKHRGLGEIF